MLPKKHRLAKQKDFRNVFLLGKYCSQSFIYLKFIKNDLEFSRFGFVLSLKISKKAVIRNRIKRQLSEIIRSKMEYIRKKYDIVLWVRPEIVRKDYWEIEEMLIILFKKAKILE